MLTASLDRHTHCMTTPWVRGAAVRDTSTVYGQVPIQWRPWQGAARAPSSPTIDRHAIADALAGQADARLQAFRRDLHSRLPAHFADVVQLHDLVHSLAVRHFPKKAVVRGPRPWQDGTLQQYAARMWGHLRGLRRWAQRPAAARCAQALFRCWRHSVHFLKMHRLAKQQGRDLRKARKHSILEEADAAIRQGQSRLFYQLIDKLAPKSRFRKFQMSQGGRVLTPAEELVVMRKHFMQIFNHDILPPDHTPAIPVHGTMHVSKEELRVFLDKLPARKAGAPNTVPGAVWRACSDLIATPLAAVLNHRWQSTPLTPPETWTVATLSLHFIAEALSEAGITGAPAELLMNWLHGCSYDLYIEDLHAHLPTTRGVKQGCPASPLLFAAFMTLVTRRLSAKLSDAWVAQNLTMFADDFHIGKTFCGYHELETLSSHIGYIMSTLRAHGMSVHATKDGRLLRVSSKYGDEFLYHFRETPFDVSLSPPLEGKNQMIRICAAAAMAMPPGTEARPTIDTPVESDVP
ncbi:Pol, partial [Symbiodinium sp. CCMP2456]